MIWKVGIKYLKYRWWITWHITSLATHCLSHIPWRICLIYKTINTCPNSFMTAPQAICNLMYYKEDTLSDTLVNTWFGQDWYHNFWGVPSTVCYDMIQCILSGNAYLNTGLVTRPRSTHNTHIYFWSVFIGLVITVSRRLLTWLHIHSIQCWWKHHEKL